MEMIEVKDLKFGYRANEPVLDIPKLSISSSQKVFLFGPSGSGKSTFLEILAGVQTPQSGHVLIDGENVTAMSSVERDRFRSNQIGYIFQNFNLVPYLSVRENIFLPLVFSSQSRLADPLSRCEELCEKLGILNLLHRKATELSVGQQQRVAAARAILLKPKLILADEPTSALDFDHREKFLRVIFQLCRESGSTLVFVSHDRSISSLFDLQISLSDVNLALGGPR